MARRRRRRSRRRRTEGGLLDRIWQVSTDPRTIGGLLLVAGAVLVTTPWVGVPEPLTTSWWVASLQVADALGMTSGLVAAALVLLAGALWNRRRLAAAPRLSNLPDPDVSVEAEDAESAGRRPRRSLVSRRWLPWIGAVCAAGGVGLVVGAWFWSQSGRPSSTLVLTEGEPVEYYQAGPPGQQTKFMLPTRVQLADLRFEEGEQPGAGLQFFAPGEEPPAPHQLTPGAGVDVEGQRFTFLGIEQDRSQLAAVLGSTEENTIVDVARKGETVKFAVDGPEYEVRELTRNYLGVVGPAVELVPPEGESFWVFQREVESGDSPEFGHSIELERLETVPAAVFAVSTARPLWPIGLGGGLFVVGLGLLILFPERLIRASGRDDDKTLMWSFNEASMLREVRDADVEEEE